ncbi:MAG: phosphatidylserine/phosphatidylglycerophosphate/cardiolipin synthase family protein [Myxococcales bacterium]|nr:phosphatidylserine/phosphatidylglycerophosphate/cardiolipin synthase family protein [Myxococcales bacterium]
MNSADLLIDGHRILPRFLRDLESARHTINIAMFLFFRDPIGEEVAALLARKAAEGVKVRVLMNIEKTEMGDPFSTGEKRMMRHDPDVHHDPTDVEPLRDFLCAHGIEVQDTEIDYDHVARVADERLRSIAAQIKDTVAISKLHVDHRKIVIIDARIGYCGGANIGAQYMFHEPFDPALDAREEGERRKSAGLSEPWWKWHDSLSRFEGPIVAELDEHFRDRWILDGGQPFDPAKPVDGPGEGFPVRAARLLCNDPNDQPNEVREKYLELIRGARESIFIENPYLYHPRIVEALLTAKRVRPSLRVDLVLTARRHNDSNFSHDAQQFAYARYLEAGIAVYEYVNHFNHLKMAVFDGRWSIHGSTNLNYRSLENDKDFELVVLVEDEAFGAWILANVRDVDIRASRRFTRRDVRGLHGRFRVRTRDPRTLLLLSRKVL